MREKHIAMGVMDGDIIKLKSSQDFGDLTTVQQISISFSVLTTISMEMTRYVKVATAIIRNSAKRAA